MLALLAAAAFAVSTGPGDHFSPQDISVAQGDTVNWTLGSSHNVHFSDASASKFGGTFSRTFSTEGTFTYVCDAHAPDMRGTVRVTPAPPVSTGPGAPPELGGTVAGPPGQNVQAIRLGRRSLRFVATGPVIGQATILRSRRIVRFVRFAGGPGLVKVGLRPLRPTHYRIIMRYNGLGPFEKGWLVK